MKAKFGAIIVDGSGKIGGHVVSKNRGGAYIRTKVTPTNPNTVAQQNVRAMLSGLSTAWAGLTEAQRSSWNGAVADYASTNVFGDLKNPSGFNLFVKLNTNLQNGGFSAVDTVPAKETVPYSEIATAIYDISSAEFNVTFPDSNYDGVVLYVQATPAVSAGKTNVNSLFRTIGVFTGVAGSIDVYGQYVAKFGALAVGANASLRLAPIVASGQKGVYQTIKINVQN